MDAHQDDVVTVQFSHHDANRFLTGSTDGTVNVHDLSLLDGAELPEDVLALTAKTSSSIHHTGYFGNQDRLLYAVTHDGSLGLWHALPTDDVDQELILWVDSPKTVLDGLEVPTDYVVDALYNEKNEQLYLLAGSHSGLAHLSHVSMVGASSLNQPQAEVIRLRVI
jgi:WD40 repeat protein